ncbi:MAG TPA: FtsQ-type POTRA domain-containing protein [Actinomycetota bacterium]
MASSTSSRAERSRRLDRVAVALAVAAVVAVGAAGVAVSRSPVFHARTVQVSGGSHLSRPELVALAGVSKATNVVWLDEGAIERRLTTHPWISAATVRAEFPSTIHIRVVERSPIAVAVDGARRLILAGDGTVLGPAGREHRRLPSIELPPVGGPEGPKPRFDGAARALAAMDVLVRSLVRRIDVRPDGTLEIRLRDGVRVAFGTPSRADRKAAALTQVLGWAAAEGQPLRSVSVVAPEAPAATIAG